MQKRTASEDSRDPSRRSVWSEGPKATSESIFDLSPSPPKVQIGDSGWTFIKIVEQMDIDRRHTQKLQDTIEAMRVSQLQHMADWLASHLPGPAS